VTSTLSDTADGQLLSKYKSRIQSLNAAKRIPTASPAASGSADEEEPRELSTFERQLGTSRFVEAKLCHTADTSAFDGSGVVKG
jgi:hypothetical protein